MNFSRPCSFRENENPRRSSPVTVLPSSWNKVLNGSDIKRLESHSQYNPTLVSCFLFPINRDRVLRLELTKKKSKNEANNIILEQTRCTLWTLMTGYRMKRKRCPMREKDIPSELNKQRNVRTYLSPSCKSKRATFFRHINWLSMEKE